MCMKPCKSLSTAETTLMRAISDSAIASRLPPPKLPGVEALVVRCSADCCRIVTALVRNTRPIVMMTSNSMLGILSVLNVGLCKKGKCVSNCSKNKLTEVCSCVTVKKCDASAESW